MRIRNKELRKRRHRKEQRIKEIVKEATAAKVVKPKAPKSEGKSTRKTSDTPKPKRTTKKKVEDAPAE